MYKCICMSIVCILQMLLVQPGHRVYLPCVTSDLTGASFGGRGSNQAREMVPTKVILAS